MTSIYHVAPITPLRRLELLAGRCFMVSHYWPEQLPRILQFAGFTAFDNGAFSYFTEMMRLRKRVGTAKERAGDRDRLLWLEQPRDWRRFYTWLEPMLFAPGRWAVIPDEIAAGSQAQDALLVEWPFGHRGAPVWHTGEPIDRLLRLLDAWPRVCIGSTDEHWQVGSDIWRARMDETWSEIARRHANPVIHMLRGTAVADLYPFASADSSSLGQNGHRYHAPLFAGSDDEFGGSVAYADRLEGRNGPKKRLDRPKSPKSGLKSPETALLL